MSFQLWPAIDVLDGRIVRLRQGDYGTATHYMTPVAELLARAAQFADGLHVVNLDGARDGEAALPAVVTEILHGSRVPVQIGGGLRSIGAISAVLELGAARAIVGSRAIEDPEFLIDAVREVGADRLVVGLDLRDGRPAVRGWTETIDRSAEEVIDRAMACGIASFIVTDIQTDGMMQGPNVSLIRQLVKEFPNPKIYASGGVASLEDLSALRDSGAAGAVIGRAWLEEALPLGIAETSELKA